MTWISFDEIQVKLPFTFQIQFVPLIVFIYIYISLKLHLGKCNFNCYSSTFTILSTLFSLNSFVVTTIYIFMYMCVYHYFYIMSNNSLVKLSLLHFIKYCFYVFYRHFHSIVISRWHFVHNVSAYIYIYRDVM